jgi:hypothetical protein
VTSTNGRHQRPPRRSRPYRDSAIAYAILGVIVIALAVVTGGDVLWATVAAVGAFLLATAWTWRALRKREQAKS